MVGRPISDWLIPQLNGNDRFQKPPLATWLSAIAFSGLGVNEFAARLPNAIAGWLTIAIVFKWARSIGGTRAGVMAAIGLFGSNYFLRFTRLAETDAAAMPWVTIAFFAIWRTVHGSCGLSQPANRGNAALYHVAAVGAALGCMAKGGPGAFPFIFLVAIAALYRSFQPIKQFVTTGAIVTFAIIAAPWFVYVWQNPAARSVIGHESAVLIGGGSHNEPFYKYLAWIAYGCLPWSGFGAFALLLAAKNARINRTSRDLLAAGLSVLLPLLALGQKQPHYLMSLLPILFVISAVELDRLLISHPSARAMRWIFHGTASLVAVAALVIGIATAFGVGRAGIWPLGFAACFFLAVVTAEVQTKIRSVQEGLVTLGVAVPLALIVIFGFYWPSLSNTPNARTLAAQVNERYGASQLGWWEKTGSLAMTFYLGRVVPSYDQNPQSSVPVPPPNVVLLDLDPIDELNSPPNGYREVFTRLDGDECMRVFAASSFD